MFLKIQKKYNSIQFIKYFFPLQTKLICLVVRPVVAVRLKGLIMHYATVLISICLQTNKQTNSSKVFNNRKVERSNQVGPRLPWAVSFQLFCKTDE